MQENYKILVVDDDMRLRALLERYLTEQGFQVRSVANAEQMDRLLTRESFHLMVLDLMLPGEDGLSICRRLRSQSNPMPIIMVTAKGEEVDRIVGLEIGADDYIPKPFNPRELLARIRAVLRRQANELPGAPSQEEAVIAFGKFKLNLGTREMFREDEPMPLYQDIPPTPVTSLYQRCGTSGASIASHWGSPTGKDRRHQTAYRVCPWAWMCRPGGL